MFKRLSPWEIIIDHFKTFYSYKTKKINYKEIVFHLLFPIVVSFFITSYINTTKDIVNSIIVAFSIASGFLLSLLIPLCDLSVHLKDQLTKDINDDEKNYPEDIQKLTNANRLAEELFYNVSFALMLCLLSVLISIIFICFDQCSCTWVKMGLEYLAYVIYILSFLTLLVIIQRVYKIFKFRLKL